MARLLIAATTLLVAVVNADIFARDVNPACNRDNCLRAVIASSATPGPASASADCSSFFKKTYTPDPTTLVVTVTNTPTVTVTATTSSTTTTTTTTTPPNQVLTTTTTTTATVTPNAKRDLEKRATVGSPSKVPAYASACAGTVRYSSACSCIGVTQSTTTLAASTVTSFTTIAAATPKTVTASTATVITTSISITTLLSASSTVTLTSTTTSTATCNIPTQDARCQQQSGACCQVAGPDCYPCTNPGAVCIKACDVNNDCIYGGLAYQYDAVVAYNDGSNLCIGYSGCTGCPSPSRLFRRAELEMSAAKIEHLEDRTVMRRVPA